MTALDIKAAAIASKLLTKFGKTVTMTIYGESTYDTASGESTASQVSTDIKAAVMSPTLNDYDSGLVINGDMFVLIAAASFTPQPTDTVTINGVLWRIITISPTYSGESIATYKLHVRS